MNQRTFPDYLTRLIRSVFSGQGQSSPTLRSAVKAYVESLNGVANGFSAAAVPEFKASLQYYIHTVAQNAYHVTDADVQKLKQDGYSEAAIYELTAAAALTSGLVRLERGLDALKGAQ